MTTKIVPLLLVFSAGCDQIQPFLPTVRFKDLEVQDIDFQHADVNFVFSVDNPDPIDISLASFDYNLGLEDVDLLSGSDADGMELTAVGSSDLALPVGLDWGSVWNTVQATKGEDYVDFGLDGNFGFDSPIGVVDVPYDTGGSFPAVRTPKFSFKKLRVTRFNLLTQEADIAVDMNVENDHGSSIHFQNFDYDISLGGTHVGHGLIDELGTVDGDTTGVMSVPLTVNLLDVGSQVIDALGGNGNLNIGLAASSDVDTPFGLLPLTMDQDGNIEVQSP